MFPTVWKYHHFSILREINSTHLEALTFDFHGFLHFMEAEMHQMKILQSLELQK